MAIEEIKYYVASCDADGCTNTYTRHDVRDVFTFWAELERDGWQMRRAENGGTLTICGVCARPAPDAGE